MSASSLILRFAPPQAGDSPKRGLPPKQPRRRAPRPPFDHGARSFLSLLRDQMDKRFCWTLAVLASVLIRVAFRLARHRILDDVKTRALLHGAERLNRAAISRIRRASW